MNDERLGSRAPQPDRTPPSYPAAPVAWSPLPPPPPPGPPVLGAVLPRRSHRAVLGAAMAAALIAGAAIGVPVGLLTRSTHSAPAGGISRGSPTAGAAQSQARALYLQALAATRGSAGFHYVSVSTGGAATQTIAGDAAQRGGRQVITIAAATAEQFTLVLVDGTVYFKGNVAALEDQLGVPAAGASSLQVNWISVSNQDGPYAVVAPGITVADQAQEAALVPASTTPIRTAGGAGATRILGTVPAQPGVPGGTGHLDVAAGSHLPISYVSTASAGGVTATSTTSFTGWGRTAAETAPPGVVAWSTLGASQPPGGYGSGGSGLAPTSTPQL